jgi:hypothetical protein
MILKGNQRAHGRELALHLLNVEDNEHAVVHELHGFLADDLIGAFREAEAISLGTQCQQYLYSLSLSPPQTAKVSVEEFERVISEIERRLGLADHPRAIVFHEKKGRRHAHCVWSRIDVAKMRAINLSHTKLRLMDISRELYIQHGWDMPAGFKNSEDRNPNGYSHDEAGQAKRAKRDPEQLKELFKSCWSGSDSGAAFAAALWHKGFCLARGDRRGFVAVDAKGEVYSLSRWCGVKTKDQRARLGALEKLPNIEEARALLAHGENTPAATHDKGLTAKVNTADLTELVSRQRQERVALAETQETRRIDALTLRRAKLPKGLRATWARLTGTYHQIVAECEAEAALRLQWDRDEIQALVDRHLLERRNLERKNTTPNLLHTLEAELQSNTETQSLCSLDPMQPLVLPREAYPFTPDQLRAQPELILDHISNKNARFSRTDILRELSTFIDDSAELSTASEQALASRKLVRFEDDKDSFTTQDFADTQKALKKMTRDMAAIGNFHVRSKHVEHAIDQENKRLQKHIGATLSDEQTAAIRHLLQPEQLSSVVGLAGAGKSTLLSVARAAWERQGYRVHGVALAGKAADELKKASGIDSRTLASLETSWHNGYEPVSAGDIVVIDEAGMVGTRQMERVAEKLNIIGAKLVLVGDPQQLQPIEAGTPFKGIVNATDAARVTEIRRQTTDWQRQASRDLAEGRVIAALSAYEDRGAVTQAETKNHAIARLVDDYVRDIAQNGTNASRLAFAHRRKDVHAINQAIRSAVRSQTEPQMEFFLFTDHGPRAFAKGERILFTKNDNKRGVKNGMLGTVELVDDNKLTVRIDGNDGLKVTFDPRRYTSFDHGYATTIHKSQGATVDRSFVLSSTTLDHHLTYVALTRHREDMRLYQPKSDTPRMFSHPMKPFDPGWVPTKYPVRSR